MCCQCLASAQNNAGIIPSFEFKALGCLISFRESGCEIFKRYSELGYAALTDAETDYRAYYLNKNCIESLGQLREAVEQSRGGFSSLEFELR